MVSWDLRDSHRATLCVLRYLSGLLCVMCLTSVSYAADAEGAPRPHSLIHRQAPDVTSTDAGTLKPAPGTASAPPARSLHRKLTKRPGQATLSGTSSPSPSQDITPTSQPASPVQTNKTLSENRVSMAATGSSMLTTLPLASTGTPNATSSITPSTTTPRTSVGSAFAGAGGAPNIAAGSAGSIGRGLQRLTTQLPGLTPLVAPTVSITSPPPAPAPSPGLTPSPSPSPSPTLSPSSSTPTTSPPPQPSAYPTTGSATLSWTLNSESDLAGYKIYVGTAPGLYTYTGSPIVLGLTGSYTLVGLPVGQTYYFAVSAFNYSGTESELSSEVSKSIY